ncbi:kinesin-like nuclear fusion protein [Linnemannia exigua]|uniref:Kinesin-like nuclear fusion protein n=1 Tax=Linnemannia exigua TaxID=604196 RepID=A0AAD4H502_9FUNG|nr:kinesin-like nuclear fusion protein [Linnemannia exigua]
MEQLNRSLSKLKPPSTIVRSNSSSALSTALAVAAAAMNENENYTASTFFGNRSIGTAGSGAGIGLNSAHNEPKKDHTLTLDMLEPLPPKTLAGAKRKAEDEAHSRPTGQHERPHNDNGSGDKETCGSSFRAPLQTQARQTGRPTPAARPTTAKAPLTSTKPDPSATAGRATRTPTPAPATGRSRVVPSVKTKVVPSQSASTRAATRSRSVTPANVAQQPLPRSAGKATGASQDVGLPAKKKRAAWDTKGRLQDTEELTDTLYQMLNKSIGNITAMTQSLQSNANKISELESFRLGLESKVVGKEIENNDILQKMSTVEQEIFMLNRKHLDDTKALKSKQAMDIEEELATQARLQREHDAVKSSLFNATNHQEQQIQESVNLRTTISNQSTTCLSYETDNRGLRHKIEKTESSIGQHEWTIQGLERQLFDSQALARQLQQKVKEEEAIRRKLYHAIMDLKGHIRVFCRVRPQSPSDGVVTSIEYPDLEGRDIVLAPAKGAKCPFTFDKVFTPSSRQEDIFEDVSQMLPSVISGGSACVFAYGLAETGKSYTLEGPSGSAEASMGLIPRSILHIYETTRTPESNEWRYSLEVQHIGVYNEVIYDLQGPEETSTNVTHEIQSGPSSRTTVLGITKVELTSAVMIGSLLRIAQRRRVAIKASLNDNYCHGHSVFTIRVTGVNSETGKTTEGVLHFVDLVASDAQLDAVKNEPETEGGEKKQGVDQSLKCLADVFLGLSSKDSHVQYRGSKLTHLLQGAFMDGSTKMLFIAHISPLSVHLERNLRSLRFAAKVNSCVLGGSGASPSSSTASTTAAIGLRKLKYDRSVRVVSSSDQAGDAEPEPKVGDLDRELALDRASIEKGVPTKAGERGVSNTEMGSSSSKSERSETSEDERGRPRRVVDWKDVRGCGERAIDSGSQKAVL